MGLAAANPSIGVAHVSSQLLASGGQHFVTLCFI